MSEHDALPYLRETILFLALSGVLIPLLQKLRINPVLGFLAAGMVLGPYGLGSIPDAATWVQWVSFTDSEDVATFAELGVIFLMFTIGLEMSVERLWALRRLVFGAGGLYVGLSALLIGGTAYVFDNPLESSVVLGLVLSFSSTAVVMQLLTQRHELANPMGQASFAILLFQDLAVVPLLVLVAVLGQKQASFFELLGMATLKGVITVAGIYLIGRRVVRPIFHHLASSRQPDTFMALTLLASLGVAALTWAAGLSMAMGAMLAGLIIAETEFRHEVEVTIAPFKGLLMGLFFMSVGMGIDLHEVSNEPLWLPISVAGLMLLKAAIGFGVLRMFGLSLGRATEGGILLSQGGEFAFIVIGTAMQFGLLSPQSGQFMLMVVSFGMLATPILSRLGTLLGDALDRRLGARQAADPAILEQLTGHVIVAGYGRVGQLIGKILKGQGVPFVAVEQDARLVARQRAEGAPVYYGDAARSALLRHLHLDRAAAVVLTMDQTEHAMHAVAGIRRLAPKLPIVARARDELHAVALRRAGATAVIPETLESALQLAGLILTQLDLGEETARGVLDEERERRISAYRIAEH
jgi:CPA2 family monovalent cation:H+ antiporter-2